MPVTTVEKYVAQGTEYTTLAAAELAEARAVAKTALATALGLAESHQTVTDVLDALEASGDAAGDLGCKLAELERAAAAAP